MRESGCGENFVHQIPRSLILFSLFLSVIWKVNLQPTRGPTLTHFLFLSIPCMDITNFSYFLLPLSAPENFLRPNRSPACFHSYVCDPLTLVRVACVSMSEKPFSATGDTLSPATINCQWSWGRHEASWGLLPSRMMWTIPVLCQLPLPQWVQEHNILAMSRWQTTSSQCDLQSFCPLLPQCIQALYGGVKINALFLTEKVCAYFYI